MAGNICPGVKYTYLAPGESRQDRLRTWDFPEKTRRRQTARKRRRFTEAQRRDIIAQILASSWGQARAIAKGLGIHENTVSKWKRKYGRESQ